MKAQRRDDSEYLAQLDHVNDTYRDIKDALGKHFDIEDVSTLVYLWYEKKVILERGCLDAATSGKICMLKDAFVITIDEDISDSDALIAYLHELSHAFLEDLTEINIDYASYHLNPDKYDGLNRDAEDEDTNYLEAVRENAREALGTLLFMHLHETSMIPPKEARLMHREV